MKEVIEREKDDEEDAVVAGAQPLGLQKGEEDGSTKAAAAAPTNTSNNEEEKKRKGEGTQTSASG